MEDLELQEEFTLEDIIREFSDHPNEIPQAPETQEETSEEVTQQEEPEQEEPTEEEETEEPEQTPEEETVQEVAEETQEEEIPETTQEETLEEAVELPQEETEEVQEETAQEEETQEEPEAEILEETEEAVEAEPAQEAETPPVTSDTIRLDTSELLKGVVHNAQPIEDEEEETQEVAAVEEKPAFTKDWEPEYEQPMGEYVPPQPIAFPPRSESREMKRKLIVGPEKRYYELTEKGLGKLQLAMFVTLLVVILSAASTVLYAKGLVPANRTRLMIFAQFMAVLVSALLGSNQLIQGFADLFKGRFSLNTLLVVTFFACCADGVFCLMQERIPCCAAFSLEIFFSLWGSYNTRHSQMGQMDVLRKATRLKGVTVKEDVSEGDPVLLRMQGQVEHFMDNYDAPTKPEKRQSVYALIALGFSLAIGAYTVVTKDLYQGIQLTAVSLLAAVPATSFIAATRPFAILQRRLHRLGTVLCGWQGVEQLTGKRVFPVRNEDLFPLCSVRMNGVKFFGSRPTDEVVAYATAVVVGDGDSLSQVFTQVLDSRNGFHYDAQELRRYEGGGLGGVVQGEPVLVGSLSFLMDMGVEIPEGIQVSQAACVAIDGELCGVFALSYEKTRSATAGLSTLSSYRRLNPVVVAGEFMMSEKFIRGKFGIKTKRLKFPAEEARVQLRQQIPDPDAQAAMLATQDGLAPIAYGVTGARALRTACNLGVALHIVGGVLGMGVVLTLVLLGAMHLLIPVNMFLYQLVWAIPGLLVTEWTRSV